MSFRDIIKKSIIEGFSYAGITTGQMLVTLGITFAIGIYIFLLYRFITRRTFYDKNFNITMSIISVVTAGILLAMQSNLVISLGMVGALSIVRFRTAIKDPMDLLFLFWSIGSGIICGAGLYKLAVLVALSVTVGILILQLIPMNSSPYLLVIDADKAAESEIMKLVKQQSVYFRIDSQKITALGMNLIVEIRLKKDASLISSLSDIEGVQNVALLHHDGEVKA